MNEQTLLNFATGWSTGYSYIQNKAKEDEVKQGKNYYLSAIYQIIQIGQLTTIASKLSELSTQKNINLPAKVFANYGFLAAIPGTLLCALVKSEHYEGLAAVANNKWNSTRVISWIPVRFPAKIGQRTVKVLDFFAEHTGNIVRVAMLAGSIALIYLGSPLFGGLVLSAGVYEVLDRGGYVPRKISLFVEKYMPTVGYIGVIVTAPVFSKILNVVGLFLEIYPSCSKTIEQKLDRGIKYIFNSAGPTLEEIDAPVVVNKQMTLLQINEILGCNPEDFETNPAHTSKWVEGVTTFPENKNLGGFFTHFDKIDWSKKCHLLLPRLKDDEIFLEHLHIKFPLIPKENIKNNIGTYIALAAHLDKVSIGAYCAIWMKAQMESLVNVLEGRTRVKGSQKDLQVAIDILPKVLAHLDSIELDDPYEFEDVLLKLAIEGGDYCARAIMRVAKELTNNVVQKGLAHRSTDDFVTNCELKLGRILQDRRQSYVQTAYRIIVDEYNVLDAIAQDVHSFDRYRGALSLGCYPLTDFERNDFGTFDLIKWRFGSSDFLETVYLNYYENIFECIHEFGELDFAGYIQQVINSNNQLTEEQKEELMTRYSAAPHWRDPVGDGPQDKFKRLILVMLGVIRRKKSPTPAT